MLCAHIGSAAFLLSFLLGFLVRVGVLDYSKRNALLSYHIIPVQSNSTDVYCTVVVKCSFWQERQLTAEKLDEGTEPKWSGKTATRTRALESARDAPTIVSLYI